ncbi:hypothetical protein ABID59_001684 [Bradyrhizobium sp. S3.3.6]
MRRRLRMAPFLFLRSPCRVGKAQRAHRNSASATKIVGTLRFAHPTKLVGRPNLAAAHNNKSQHRAGERLTVEMLRAHSYTK